VDTIQARRARYRDVDQSFSLFLGLLSLDGKRHEGATVLGHGIDGDQQFAHGSDEGNLVQFATLDQSSIKGLQPRIAAADGCVKVGITNSYP